TPSSNGGGCAQGYVWVGGGADVAGSCCLQSQVTSKGICCGQGQTPGGSDNSQCVGTNGCTPPLVQVGNQCCSQSDLQPGGRCAPCPNGEPQTCAVTQNAGGGYGVTCSCCAASQVTSTG